MIGIFRIRLKSTPINFGNWVHSEITRLYRGLEWLPEEPVKVFPSGVLWPPEDDDPHYHYQMDGIATWIEHNKRWYSYLGICIIRAKPISDSVSCRSLIPFHADR